MGKRAGPFRVPLVNQLLRGISVRQVHAGAFHTYITTEDHRVLSFGWNVSGQCGVESKEPVISVPAEVPALRGEIVRMIRSGAMHSHFVTSDGRIWSVGNNSFGQLGLSTLADMDRPTPIPLPNSLANRGLKVRLLACGDFFTIAIFGDNQAYAWGRNNSCQVGAQRANCVRQPERCWALARRAADVIALSCGSDHTAVLMKNGIVEQFGSNAAKQFGQFFNGDATPALTKISLGSFSGSKVTHIACSGNVTTALDSDGSLYMWGSRHTIHRGTREGLSEHPEVVWRVAESESVRFWRIGRNHLHILTRSGMLYTWVFGRLKRSPSPFLPQKYYDYYASRYENAALERVRDSTDARNGNKNENGGNYANNDVDGSESDPIDSNSDEEQGGNENRLQRRDDNSGDANQVKDSNAESSETLSSSGLIIQAIPSIVEPNMSQMDNIDLDEGYEDDVEFQLADLPATGAIGDSDTSSSSSEEEQANNEEDSGSEADDIAPRRPNERAAQPSAPAETSDGSPRVALPRKPWRSYFVGNSYVKDIVCGAFTTQILLFGQFFATEFSLLVQQPDHYFPDVKLVLADQTVISIHAFWMIERCPSLLSRFAKNNVLPVSDPQLLRLVLKFIYYGYTYLSDLSSHQLSSLRQIVKQLKLNHSELALALVSEVKFREGGIPSAEIPPEEIQKSRSDFQAQLAKMYESRNRTDYELVAIFSDPIASKDEEMGENNSKVAGSSSPKGNSIFVHKAILSIRVPFFDALFHSKFSDSGAQFYEMECTYEVLDHFLRYIYYDFTNFSVESAQWILLNSEMFFVDKPRERLINACTSVLRRYGKKKELKETLAMLNHDYDPYEDGRYLPTSSTAEVEMKQFSSSSTPIAPSASSSAVAEKPEKNNTADNTSETTDFSSLEDTPRNAPVIEVEMGNMEIETKQKRKKSKKKKKIENPRLVDSNEKTEEQKGSKVELQEDLQVLDVLDEEQAPPRVQKRRKKRNDEDSD